MPFWVGAQNGVPAEGVIRQIPLKVRAPLTSRLRSPPSGNRTGAAQSQPSPSRPRAPEKGACGIVNAPSCLTRSSRSSCPSPHFSHVVTTTVSMDGSSGFHSSIFRYEYILHTEVVAAQIQNHLSRTRVTIAANTTAPMLLAGAGPSRESSSQSP